MRSCSTGEARARLRLRIIGLWHAMAAALRWLRSSDRVPVVSCAALCSLLPDGSKDPSSLHGSCPTLRGNKWSGVQGSNQQTRAVSCAAAALSMHA